MRMTEAEYQAWQAKQAPVGRSDNPEVPDDAPESSLQARCERYLEEHGHPYHHDRSRRKNKPGMVDLVVALPGGRTVWCELKAPDGRLSEAQKKFRLGLLHHGHEWREVRSFRRFVQIMEGRI